MDNQASRPTTPVNQIIRRSENNAPILPMLEESFEQMLDDVRRLRTLSESTITNFIIALEVTPVDLLEDKINRELFNGRRDELRALNYIAEQKSETAVEETTKIGLNRLENAIKQALRQPYEVLMLSSARRVMRDAHSENRHNPRPRPQ